MDTVRRVLTEDIATRVRKALEELPPTPPPPRDGAPSPMNPDPSPI